jgi:hypothetical protein
MKDSGSIDGWQISYYQDATRDAVARVVAQFGMCCMKDEQIQPFRAHDWQ